MSSFGRLLLLGLIVSLAACTEAKKPTKKAAGSGAKGAKAPADTELDSKSEEKEARPSKGETTERPAAKSTKAPAESPPVSLRQGIVRLGGDDIKYSVFTPLGAQIKPDTNRFEVHGAKGFDMQYELGQFDLAALTRNFKADATIKIVTDKPDTLVLKKTVPASGQDKASETYEIYLNRTVGHREFKISTSPVRATGKPSSFTARDSETMVKAAEQFALGEALPEDPVALLERLGVKLYRDLDGMVDNDYSGGLLFAKLPTRGGCGSTLKLLDKVPTLTKVEANIQEVKASDWSALNKLPKLQILDLKGTSITDEGVDSLVTLKGLTSLNLQSTQITDQGIAKIKAAIPNCKITK